MRLARVNDGHRDYWGVVDTAGKTIREIDGDFAEWAPRVTNGAGPSELDFIGAVRDLEGATFLPPIEPVNRVIVAGANYSKHLKEFGVGEVSQPIAFLKAYGALIGANDPIRYPPLTEKLDYEVELVVVIGSDEIDLENPYTSVLGYTVGNDVSARDLQRSGPKDIGMDLFAAKSQDRTTGLGPWIVTKDEFDPGSPSLNLKLTVNGEIRQDGSSGEMTWDVGELIKFVHQRSSFRAGDIMFTGTPSGVADASGRYLQRGDVVEATVEKIGTLRNIVR